MSFVGNIVDGLTGKSAERKANEAAAQSADFQQQGLDYLIESEALPKQFRDLALQRFAGLAGLEGGTGDALGGFDQQQLIDDARSSPLYQSILGTQGASEEAILRGASATGGLRSGNANIALADNAQQLERDALLQSYNQQLQQKQYGDQQLTSLLGGLTGTPSAAPQIAQGYGNIGNTLAQGQIAGAQSRSGALGNLLNVGALFALSGGLGGGAAAGAEGAAAAGGGGLAFSDIRLKKNIKPIGKKDGQNWYEWTWNKAAEKIGLSGKSQGVMAHEIDIEHVLLNDNGYLMVNYGGLQNG